MSDDTFEDPPPPAESTGLRGDDLINKVCVFYPRRVDKYDPTPAADGRPAMKGSLYVECEVWTIGAGGIEEHDPTVRITWWRVVPGFKEKLGTFIAGKVRVDEKSRVIDRLTDQQRTAVKACRDEIIAQRDATTAELETQPVTEDLSEHSDDPF